MAEVRVPIDVIIGWFAEKKRPTGEQFRQFILESYNPDVKQGINIGTGLATIGSTDDPTYVAVQVPISRAFDGALSDTLTLFGTYTYSVSGDIIQKPTITLNFAPASNPVGSVTIVAVAGLADVQFTSGLAVQYMANWADAIDELVATDTVAYSILYLGDRYLINRCRYLNPQP